MKTQHQNSTIHLIAASVLMLSFTACDTLNKEQEDPITDEELEIAGQIIGSSLSDADGGLLSSLYDAISEVDEEGIRYEGPAGSKEGNMHRKRNGNGDESGRIDNGHQRATGGRGSESDYHSSYDPETGEHTIYFIRKFEGPLVSKSLKVRSVYIYTNTDGDFLEFPRRQQDQIETIDYKGTREGTTVGQIRSSRFYRYDTFYLEGVSAASPVLTLAGTHQGNGEMKAALERRDIEMERAYEVHFELDDIRVYKERVKESGNLENGITGFISYRLKMSRTVNGETSERNISGVVELTGDGTALLRFDKLQQFFRIALGSGNVTRPDDTGSSDRDRKRS